MRLSRLNLFNLFVRSTESNSFLGLLLFAKQAGVGTGVGTGVGSGVGSGSTGVGTGSPGSCLFCFTPPNLFRLFLISRFARCNLLFRSVRSSSAWLLRFSWQGEVGTGFGSEDALVDGTVDVVVIEDV